METRPPDLTDHAITSVLEDGWGLAAESIEYAPVGFGSHHWIVRADGRRWFVTVDDLDGDYAHRDRAAAFTRFSAAFTTAARLRDDCGLGFVVAPVPATDGTVLRRLDARYSIALLPFVDGAAVGRFTIDDPAVRSELIGHLAALHRVAPPESVPARGVDLPGRDAIEQALLAADVEWQRGPYGEAARDWLAVRERSIRVAMQDFDVLAEAVGARGRDVVTHGEPHAANVVRTADGLVLVDWDMVGLAQPERDLWLVAGESSADLGQYEELTGRRPDPDALELYRRAWDFADVAAYVTRFRRPHTDDADSAKSWRGLAAAPY